MAKQIQRNSVYLTDDYVQALGNTQPAKISKYMLLHLPNWYDAENYMYVSPEDLGLSSSEVDPNVLLPAFIEQYWLNLCGYARQIHATVETGDVIEDFAEQAFWKALHRLIRHEITDLSQCIVAESNDVIANSNSIDGTNFMQIVLSIAAGTTPQLFAFDSDKPSYLHSVDKVPNTTTPQTLVGEKQAVYDYGLTYYDLSSANCLTAYKASDAVGTVQFNAILLFYENAGITQVAGIYFPNKFMQNGDEWLLPLVQLSNDTTLGYEINIAINANNQIDSIKVNPSLASASLAFSDMYRKMVNVNAQLTAQSNKIAALELQIANMSSLLNKYSFDMIQRKLDQFSKLLNTHFAGAISTDKLLDLFIAAKQNTGNLALSMQMSDLTKALLGTDIIVHGNSLGQYADGDVIAAGTSINEILRKILDSRIGQKYIWPFAQTLLENAQVNYVAVADNSAVNTISSYQQNDAGSLTSRIIQTDVTGRGVRDELTTMSTDNILFSLQIETIVKHDKNWMTLHKVIQQVNYNDGPVHQYSDGSDIPGSIVAGTATSICYVMPFNYVVLVYAAADTSIQNIVDTFQTKSQTDLESMAIPTDELSSIHTPTDRVAYIIQLPCLDRSIGQNCVYADLGIDVSNCEDVNLALLGQEPGSGLTARITRIEDWDGTFDLSNIQPAMI